MACFLLCGDGVARPRRLALLLVILAPGTLVSPSLALHRQTPVALAVTRFPAGDSCCVSSNPKTPGRIAFESTSDLLGNGSTGREIFTFDMHEPRILTQVTDFVGDSAHASISASGGRFVAFDSAAGITGPANGSRQVFLWNRRLGQFTRLTNGTADSTYPAVDNRGKAVVFQSAADLLGVGSTGTNVYLWQSRPVCSLSGCSNLLQLTNAGGESSHPAISPDARGSWVVFQSDAPLLGPANGFKQIYAYDRPRLQLTRLTNGVGDSVHPSVTGTGRLVVFESRADLLGNGSSGSEIFLFDRETGMLRQITSSATGDSFMPSVDGSEQFVSFVSTADLLGTGSTGQHVFAYDLRTRLTFQLTKSVTGDGSRPVSTGWIQFFDSTEDPMQTGVTGRQIYAMNLFGRVPSATLGAHTFTLQPGSGGGGSRVRVTTAGGIVVTDLGPGKIPLEIGPRDLDGDAPVHVPAAEVGLPAVALGPGALCFTPTDDGTGVLDCDGARPGANVAVARDHNTDLADPLCLLGCREGAPCQGGLLGPHQSPCPFCLGGTCSGGLNAGQACGTDNACQPHDQCVGGVLGLCNGPVTTVLSGTFAAGAMQLALPLTASLATSAGLDGTFCSSDDTYAVQNVPGVLRLTTGTAQVSVLDADNVGGATLADSQTGVPFGCGVLQSGVATGATLVGSFTLLDVPGAPGLRDAIVGLRLEAQ